MVVGRKLLNQFIAIFLLCVGVCNNLFAVLAGNEQGKIYTHLKADEIVTPSLKSIATSSESSDDLNAAVKSALLNYGNEKLTPSPSEDIDLYTGTLKLHYVDFSTPIAPGLNLEVTRVYDSTVYNYVNHLQVADIWMYDINLPSWNIATTYLLDRNLENCTLPNDSCDLIVVNANGSHESLRVADGGARKWTSKNGSVFYENTEVLTDKRGFKYYFGEHRLAVNGGVRMYLTKVETPDGKHWLRYHYRGHYLKQITSSDPNKTIDINLEPVEFHKQHGSTYAMYEPSGITFNNKRLITYQYNFFDGGASFGRLALTKVTKANGETINYGYQFLTLSKSARKIAPEHWRLMLNSVTYSNGESASYEYVDDMDLYAHLYLTNLRVGKVTHYTKNKFNATETSNVWVITHDANTTHQGIKTKTVAVQGPYHATKTVFSHSSYEFAWQAGLPLQKIIYKSHDMSDSNMLEQALFTWDKKLFSNKYYYLSSSIKEAGFDIQTYKPRLSYKSVTRYSPDGQDTYKFEQRNFDEYDNPQEIILSSSDGHNRVITQTFYNNIDKNILGLRTSFAIDGHTLIKESYDEYGNVISETKQGITTQYSYIDGLLNIKTDNKGNLTHYTNYAGVTPQVISYSDGTRVFKTVNLDGTIASSTDPNGNTTHYEYNANQELIKETPAIGASTVHNFDNLNFEKHTVLANYNAYEEYNHAGLLLSKLENNDIKKIIEYDGLGRKIFESIPYSLTSGNVDTTDGHYYQYDSLNRPTSDCYPTAGMNCVNYYYLANNTVKTVAANGEYSMTTYLAYGEPSNGKVSQIKQANTTTDITRDYLDAVTKVTQGKISKYYEYDANHNLIKYTEPESGVTEYKYDKVGNIITKIQNNNEVTNYAYHERNYKLLNIGYSDVSNNEKFSYDNTGNLLSASKGNISKRYQYDETNKLIKEIIILNNLIFRKFKIKNNNTV